MAVGLYLSIKEVWRNRGRFFLFSLVIALITVLVIFVGGLSEGLGAGNREYIQKLNGELVAYQSQVDLSIATSKLSRSKLAGLKRVEGVEDVGPIGFASASVVSSATDNPLDVVLLGVEPGKPGEPEVTAGNGLTRRSGKDAIIDRNVAIQAGLAVGDRFQIKSIQGTEEKFFDLVVAGVTDSRKYSIRPSVVVPFLTWERIKPQGDEPAQGDLIANIAAVKLANPEDWRQVSRRLEAQVSNVEVVDRKTAYESTPGYSAQQSTLNTQRTFVLLIGILVIGGFFQIQTLQKVAQIGMLKAIGAGGWTIGMAALLQILIVTFVGVAIGSAVTVALSLSFPPTIPIIFAPQVVAASIVSLLVIGPLGGLVSIRQSLRVEPLTALGLS